MNQTVGSGDGYAGQLRSQGEAIPASIPDNQWVNIKELAGGKKTYEPAAAPGEKSGGNGTLVMPTEENQCNAVTCDGFWQKENQTEFGQAKWRSRIVYFRTRSCPVMMAKPIKYRLRCLQLPRSSASSACNTTDMRTGMHASAHRQRASEIFNLDEPYLYDWRRSERHARSEKHQSKKLNRQTLWLAG